MPRALKVCSCTSCDAHDGSCPELTPSGRCPRCVSAAAQARRTAAQRGYGERHRRRFRRRVLQRDPFCTCTDQDHAHHRGRRCAAPSTVADHHPLDRRQLELKGLDPDDPVHGRGLCAPCHNAHTARAQPGGWNR